MTNLGTELRIRIVGNPKKCRTEAEIFDESQETVAIVYENFHGWQTEVVDERMGKGAFALEKVVERAKEALSPYVNRRGDNPPEGLTVGALSLWLMIKDDGTALGKRLE